MNKEDPVAWRSTSPDGKLSNKFACKPTEGNWVEPLYATPPKQWVGLTDEEIGEVISGQFAERNYWVKITKALESKIKEKNHG
jgi:hypothetical protein